MNAHVGRTSAIHLSARSLLAFALEPKAPLSEWLEALDGWLTRSPNFFSAKPVILQLGGLDINLKEYRDLLGQLARRHIRVMAVEKSEPAAGWPASAARRRRRPRGQRRQAVRRREARPPPPPPRRHRSRRRRRRRRRRAR